VNLRSGLILAGALVLGACESASSPSLPAPSATSSSAAETCAPVDLKTPAGTPINLTGTWRAGPTTIFARQLGSCVGWTQLSDIPGQDLGAVFMAIFQGEIAPDFTVSGEWMTIVPAGGAFPDPLHGSATFTIEVETTSGAETVVLRSPATGQGPYGQGVVLTYLGPLLPVQRQQP
jgi:hypothetical protein